MSIQTNYFISALEYGSRQMITGVSCKEMFDYLKNSSQINESALANFRGWFYNKGFFVTEYEDDLRNKGWDQIIRPDDIETRYDEYKGFIRGDAYFKYLEYIEVREALKNSRSSTKTAIAAIIISTIVGIIQICLTLLGHN